MTGGLGNVTSPFRVVSGGVEARNIASAWQQRLAFRPSPFAFRLFDPLHPRVFPYEAKFWKIFRLFW